MDNMFCIFYSEGLVMPSTMALSPLECLHHKSTKQLKLLLQETCISESHLTSRL